ncbi:hypothetical protein K438DRAFT_1206276 [Mycena galopus ATCC 62051]|nr:hypothetical protein K438DRAFT_1206276 [Mycena galopus ATCC 62051]
MSHFTFLLPSGIACILLVSTGEKSTWPIDLLDHTIEVLQTRHNFANSIKKSVTDGRSEFPNKADRPKLVDRLVDIVMENVDSLRAA